MKVNDSVVQLSLAGERFHSSETMLWSSTQVSVASAGSEVAASSVK